MFVVYISFRNIFFLGTCLINYTLKKKLFSVKLSHGCCSDFLGKILRDEFCFMIWSSTPTGPARFGWQTKQLLKMRVRFNKPAFQITEIQCIFFKYKNTIITITTTTTIIIIIIIIPPSTTGQGTFNSLPRTLAATEPEPWELPGMEEFWLTCLQQCCEDWMTYITHRTYILDKTRMCAVYLSTCTLGCSSSTRS